MTEAADHEQFTYSLWSVTSRDRMWCDVTAVQVDDRDSGTASDDDSVAAANNDIVVEMLMLHSLTAAAAAAAAAAGN